MANRLALESSPYLLQHANNPVDWFPWGEAAFERARALDRPIFLSIGYSTCHWCHVMERESFESPDIAAVLNDHFVSIKMDREERPDIDRVYMTFVQATTGQGGWPMSVWLTPDLRPFYGGTYFPPRAQWGRPGFVDVLLELAQVWKDDRPRILASADVVTERLRALSDARDEAIGGPSGVAGPDALTVGVEHFRRAFDARHGGFAGAPKFPRPAELAFLLREFARTGEADLRDMSLETFRAMAVGGLRDHVGGGFHRYSVDERWRVPHFEKMLYDQAQLVLAGLECAQASGDAFYSAVAEDTLAYVARDSHASRRRVLLGRGRRQHSARSGWRAGSPRGGGGLLHLVRIGSERTVRRAGGPGREAAVRHRAQRECAGRSPRRVHRQEPALHGRDDRGYCGAHVARARRDCASPGIGPAAHARGAQLAAAAAPRRQGPHVVERIDAGRVRPRGPCARRALDWPRGAGRTLRARPALGRSAAAPAAPLAGRTRRHRRVLRGLRGAHLGAARARAGDGRARVARMGAHAASETGCPLLGRR